MSFEWPRLLYVGDVPVEQTRFGSALLYRLLEEYPPERLRIVEPSYAVVQPAARLAGVRYLRLRFGPSRLYRTRLAPVLDTLAFYAARIAARQLEPLVQQFQPQVLLTAFHGYSWLSAAQLAPRPSLPLHVAVHDDMPRSPSAHPWIRSALGRAAASVYRQASHRYCISGCMASEYESRYGVAGQIMYPFRARQALVYTEPPPHVAAERKPFRVVYAGSIYAESYWLTFARLARALESLGAELWIYAKPAAGSALPDGLTRGHVKLLDNLQPARFTDALRDADALFLNLPFERRLADISRTSFPSKLADYTAAGVPIVVAGPPEACAVVWARQRPMAAVAVERDDEAAYQTAFAQLVGNAELRLCLARGALRANTELFSYGAAQALFRAGLAAPQS